MTPQGPPVGGIATLRRQEAEKSPVTEMNEAKFRSHATARVPEKPEDPGNPHSCPNRSSVAPSHGPTHCQPVGAAGAR